MPITLLITLPLRHTELLRVRGQVLPECAWMKRCWKSSASFHRAQKHAGGLFNKSRYSQLLIAFPSWMQYLTIYSSSMPRVPWTASHVPTCVLSKINTGLRSASTTLMFLTNTPLIL